MAFLIHSKENPKIKHLRGLVEQSSYRRKQGQTVLEGAHLVESYLTIQQPHSIYTTEEGFDHPDNQQSFEKATCPIFIVDQQYYKSLSPLGQTIPLMAIIECSSQDQSNIQYHMDTLVLDGIQDPGNVGTLLRSAAAVGIKQIISTQGTANLWSPRVLRASMGAHFSLDLFENIEYHHIINQFKIPLYATSSHQSKSIYQLDLTQPCVWILGNEGQGVDSSLLEQAQAVVIPQPGGQESLNVAIAGSVCLFEMMRQRI